MEKSKRLFESHIGKLLERAKYTHKTHEKYADRKKNIFEILSCMEVILSVLTTTSLVLVIFQEGKVQEYIAASCSALLLGLNIYMKDKNFLDIIQAHKNSASDILVIRDQLESLIIDTEIGNKAIEDLQQTRDDLMAKLHKFYRDAPRTDKRAYQKASKALNQNEEFTFKGEK